MKVEACPGEFTDPRDMVLLPQGEGQPAQAHSPCWAQAVQREVSMVAALPGAPLWVLFSLLGP